MNNDSNPKKVEFPTALRNGATWVFMALGLAYGAWEFYQPPPEGKFALEPLYGYLFVEHHAISMPIIVVAIACALLFDQMRAKRTPERRLRLFWKVVAFFAMALAGYFAINGIQLVA